MPFVDRSTLTYPATNSFPVRKWLDPLRSPTSGDFRNFQIFDLWINENNQTAWLMVDRTATFGTWIQIASTGIGILTVTGDAGGAVGPDGASNINLLSGASLTVTGNPGTNTLTITLDSTVPLQFNETVGSATAAANIINVVGAGGISTSGAGSTITITAGATIPTTFTEDAGSAVPAANNLNIVGAGGITTSGAGSTVTIHAGATIATTYTTDDSNTAVPAANNLNVFGAGSITTSSAGSTITIHNAGGGLSWNDITVVGPTSMLINNGYVSDSASQVQLTLPLTAPFGSIIRVVGKNTGGWIIGQNAGQSIKNGALSTTAGVPGTLAASEATATVELLCVTADTVFRVIDGQGNLIFT